jgi:ABC-type polysaccharide/polyol phosphate transport system ATPase subunit
MSEYAIQSVALGKCYRIGAAPRSYRSLRDAIAGAAAMPLDRLRRARAGGSMAWRAGARPTVWALRDVDFTVRRGEALGIIGRNGAGKSTLLKILSRITSPSVGYADVWGRVGSLLEVGTGFHPELTGRDNVYLNGAILGMDRRYIDATLDEIVEFAGVGRFINTPVKRYSSGMALRLAFAVAAHLEPDVLIIDEVLAVGDAEFQKKCIARMDAVAREGRTVLFVSHDLTVVQRLCSRCILLEDGRVAGDGGTQEMVARYLARGDQVAAERWIDLSDTSRAGAGGARLDAVWFSSGNEEVDGIPYTYGPLEVRLAISSVKARTVDRFHVWLANAQGTRLLAVDSLAMGGATQLREGRTVVAFRIPRLNLNAGIYTFNFKLRNKNGVVFDHLEPAFHFDVVDVRADRPVSDLRVGAVPCEPTLIEAPRLDARGPGARRVAGSI